jgi:hypothetical protein
MLVTGSTTSFSGVIRKYDPMEFQNMVRCLLKATSLIAGLLGIWLVLSVLF